MVQEDANAEGMASTASAATPQPSERGTVTADNTGQPSRKEARTAATWGCASKRKIDDELLRELKAAQDAAHRTLTTSSCGNSAALCAALKWVKSRILEAVHVTRDVHGGYLDTWISREVGDSVTPGSLMYRCPPQAFSLLLRLAGCGVDITGSSIETAENMGQSPRKKAQMAANAEGTVSTASAATLQPSESGTVTADNVPERKPRRLRLGAPEGAREREGAGKREKEATLEKE